METGESQGKVGDFSEILKGEVTNPRKDTPFVVLISLLATLALARAFVLLTGAAGLRARSVRLGHRPGRKSDRAVGASEDIPGSGDRDDDGVRTYHGMRLPSR